MVRLLRSGIFSDDQVDRTVNSVIQWQRQNSGKFFNFFEILKILYLELKQNPDFDKRAEFSYQTKITVRNIVL